ncbi:hypothetical protein MKW98_009358, partial [Papaver atlanticum]
TTHGVLPLASWICFWNGLRFRCFSMNGIGSVKLLEQMKPMSAILCHSCCEVDCLKELSVSHCLSTKGVNLGSLTLQSSQQVPILLVTILTALTDTFHAFQPLKVPGFSFAWLELVSHRSFMPKLLYGNSQKTSLYVQHLLVDLFKFMEPHLRIVELALAYGLGIMNLKPEIMENLMKNAWQLVFGKYLQVLSKLLCSV